MRRLFAVSALSLSFVFATGTTRTDPYKNYEFRVSLGGGYVAAFSQFNQRNGGATGSANGVPIQVPGSLVGRAGTVTLICSAAPNPGSPTVTLVCSIPTGGTGSDVGKVPGFSKFEAITLERGVTHDPGFQSWASSIRASAPRDVYVDIFNEAGQKTGSYRLHRCTVATFQGMPSFGQGGYAFSVVALEFHCDSVVTH